VPWQVCTLALAHQRAANPGQWHLHSLEELPHTLVVELLLVQVLVLIQAPAMGQAGEVLGLQSWVERHCWREVWAD
jgi:hypothetical protein